MQIELALDDYPIGITLIVLSSVLAVLGLRLLKQFIPDPHFSRLQEAGGTSFQVIGTVYAVLLGLIVSDAIVKYGDAEKSISSEANGLVAVYSLAQQISPEEKKQEISTMVSDYLNEIMVSDWVHMENDTNNYPARGKLRNLYVAIQSIEPVSENDKAILPILLEKTLEIADLRRFRIDAARAGIPKAEWIFLFFGTLTTILSAYLYRIESTRAQEISVLLITCVIATNLYMVYLFGEPFSGTFIASRQPLMTAQAIMDGSYFDPLVTSSNSKTPHDE